jgi:hypothetical protein
MKHENKHIKIELNNIFVVRIQSIIFLFDRSIRALLI